MTETAVRAGTEEKLGYRPGLDGLRGIAVLLVMLGHAGMPGMSNGGLPGVTLFFTLSGFLITSLLLEEGKVDLRAFYLRRARRLLPALAALMLAAWVIGRLTVEQAAVTGFYVGNWPLAFGADLGVLSHTWSLAIEEQFYLVWPLVLIAFGGRARTVAMVGIAVAVVARLVIWQGPDDSDLVYFSTFTRIDAVLAGCLLAFSRWRPGRWWPAALAALVGMSAVTVPAFNYRYGLGLAAVLAVVVIAGAVESPGVLGHPVLRWFGQRSYGLYLWHTALVLFFAETIGPAEQSVVFILGLVAAEVSWQLVERPFLTRRRTAEPPRAPARRSPTARS